MYSPSKNILAPIIHDSQIAHKTQRWLEKTRKYEGAFSIPENLSIFTAHNHHDKSLFERNMDYLGVNSYDVCHLKHVTWNNAIRIKYFLEYLKEKCTTEYVLFCDSDDVIFHKNPAELLDKFHLFNAEVVYNSTRWMHGYQCMPDKKKWADTIHPNRYLNGGAFLGKRLFLIELYSCFSNYLCENPVSNADFFGNELNYCDNFPYGISSDQTILRYLEPDFYPKLKVDDDNILFWRNDNITQFDLLIRKLKRKIHLTLKAPLKKLIN
jgi:hypothetical protein